MRKLMILLSEFTIDPSDFLDVDFLYTNNTDQIDMVLMDDLVSPICFSFVGDTQEAINLAELYGAKHFRTIQYEQIKQFYT